jgi:hypothetical protein
VVRPKLINHEEDHESRDRVLRQGGDSRLLAAQAARNNERQEGKDHWGNLAHSPREGSPASRHSLMKMRRR